MPDAAEPDGCNDILVRFTREGEIVTVDTYIGVSDDSLLPQMRRTADYLRKCLEIYQKSDASIDYSDAIRYAEGLVAAKPRIVLAH